MKSTERTNPQGPGLGATYRGKQDCRFSVWAPLCEKIELRLLTPQERLVPLRRTPEGYHEGEVDGVPPGSLYLYRLESGKERPDPASRHQPQGVHGPSAVVDRGSFRWQDRDWKGVPQEDLVLYEIHTGAFTPEGTFEAIIPHLDELRELGITALELMPVAQFPGGRNWGYDGVYPFAVQESYGGPEGLKRLVEACHSRGLAVVLDVVYNHLGPEGNYLGDFGPYFSERHRTPWGPAINFDGPESDEVRRYFIENALEWITEFHLDGLRLDAVHGIVDLSAVPFLGELAQAVRERARRLGRQVYLFPESDLNDARLIEPPEVRGYGFDAQWSDDFHHLLHVLLTGERSGYYRDFSSLAQLEKVFREGFAYTGEYSVCRRRRHGNSPRGVPARRFIVFAQNHDQVGNRMLGERLSGLVSFEALKVAAGTCLLSPFIPLLFMGEEYGETAPFQYFVSHSDPALIEAMRRGRQEEFRSFGWQGEPPDPQDGRTFLRSKLRREESRQGRSNVLLELHQRLLRLRRELPALRKLSKEDLEVTGREEEKVLAWRRWSGDEQVFGIFHFGDRPQSVTLPVPARRWRKLIDSWEERWQGPGSAVPGTLDSQGEITLELKPTGFALFT